MKEIVPKIPNENIMKLRLLSAKLCGVDDTKYKKVVDEMKTIITNSKQVLGEASTNKTKIHCYEVMCVEIMELLKNI